MNPTAKVVISTVVALLSTYVTAVSTVPADQQASGISWPAAITALVSALNALGNLYTKKPTQQ